MTIIHNYFDHHIKNYNAKIPLDYKKNSFTLSCDNAKPYLCIFLNNLTTKNGLFHIYIVITSRDT